MKEYPNVSARHYKRLHEKHTEKARQAHREADRYCGMGNATEAISAVRRRHRHELACLWYDRANRTAVHRTWWGRIEICMVDRMANLTTEELEKIARDEV